MNHTLTLNPYFLLRHPFVLNWKFSFKIFWILSFSLIFSFSILYVVRVNEMIKGSYLIKNYEQEIEAFSQINKILEINFANISSLENIEKIAQDLDFEKIKQVKYIQILESSLVRNEKLAD